MNEFHTLLYQVADRNARLLLNRPHRLNAVTKEMYDELEQAIDLAEREDSVRVITLSGMGRAFCVGADLKEHFGIERTPEERRTYAEAAQRVCARLQESPKPVLCFIRGYALGAGAEMALSCDFVIMDEAAQIGFPEVSIGTYIGGGLSFLLTQLVGAVCARELLYLGRRITGKEAERIGLIYKSTSEPETEAAMLAEKLSDVAPIPLAIAKRQLRENRTEDPTKAMRREVDALLKCMESEDWKEGVRAFNEKRPAQFKGK